MWVYTCCLLLVSTYLYRYVLCFLFLFDLSLFVWECSAPSRGDGNPTPWLAHIHDCGLVHLHTYITAYTQHFISTHSNAHTQTVNTPKNCCSANQEEDQVKMGHYQGYQSQPLVQRLWYTMDGEADRERTHHCLFICVCKSERMYVCVRIAATFVCTDIYVCTGTLFKSVNGFFFFGLFVSV